MWWGARCNGHRSIHSTSHHHRLTIFHIQPWHFRHSTPYISHHSTHLIPPDHTSHSHSGGHSVVWTDLFCNARCGMLCLIHPNVAAMWNKVQCRICAIWATCEVMQCHRDGVVKHGATWNGGVLGCRKIWLWNIPSGVAVMVWQFIGHGGDIKW